VKGLVFINNGFIKCAAAAVKTLPCDVSGNSKRIIEKYIGLAEKGVKLAAFPELCITGYSCGDFYRQSLLLKQARQAAEEICKATSEYECVQVAGCPVELKGKLYNTALVMYKGRILGIVPKSHLPEYNEFDEIRYFAAPPTEVWEINFANQKTFFGTDIIFTCENLPSFTFAVEICEDATVPVPPSVGHSRNGANIIVNIAASSEAAGKSETRRKMLSAHSSRIYAGYIYACTGEGESSSVCTFSGNSFIFENGVLLAESKPFEYIDCITEIDCERIISQRRSFNTYTNSFDDYMLSPFSMTVTETALTRPVSPYPFIPRKNADERWREILDIQSYALKKRLETAHAKPLLNVSGGLDSTLALIVCLETMKLMGKSPSDVICITSPGPGTTGRTKNNAKTIITGLGATYREISIKDSVIRHLKSIGHDTVSKDLTFENAQARERTQIAMDIANMENALMVGTGDMSELALGFTTYGGDHMTMYSVNAGVPKSIIKYIIRYYADNYTSGKVKRALYDICETPVSPELLPSSDGKPAQKTEEIIGPYAIHDFILFYIVKYGFSPLKIYRLAKTAFGGIYPEDVLKSTFITFYKRFIPQQYKRSSGPDSPKIGSVSVTPQNGWKAPSDVSNRLWEAEVSEISYN
jgi:NAD+ synthase (glutamine-hydrolysing)